MPDAELPAELPYLTCHDVCHYTTIMSTKDTVIQIRLSRPEKRLIQDSAKREGLPTSAWLRLVCLNANLRSIVSEHETLAWNARGAADAKAVESRIRELVAGEIVGAGIAIHVADAIRKVDR